MEYMLTFADEEDTKQINTPEPAKDNITWSSWNQNLTEVNE